MSSGEDDIKDESTAAIECILYAQSNTGIFANIEEQEGTKNGPVYHSDFDQKATGGIFHPGRLCRLCARGTDPMVYIFSESGRAHHIVEKINTSLPVTVRCDDQLPKQLCEDCVQKLDLCHEFAETCIQAEEKLKLLSSEKLFVSELVGDPELPKDDDTIGKISVADVMKHNCPLCCSGLMVVDSNPIEDTRCSFATDKSIVKVVRSQRLTTTDSNDGNRDEKQEEHAVQPTSSGNEASSATCRICANIFKCLEDCLVHAKVHSMDDLFPCSMCDLCFSTESSFLSHCVEHRLASAAPEKLPCPTRDDVFSDVRPMAGHPCRRKFRCPDCSKAFRSEARLAFHQQQHGKPGTATCQHCGKAFACERNLFEHVRLVHLGEKAHCCPRCGTAFQLRTRLVAHMRSHSGERPFKCRMCRGRFYDNATLKGHLVTHLDVKPFQCDKCGRCFSRKTVFKHHVLSHDKDVKPPLSKIYKCKLCPDVALASYSKLVEHRKETHPTDEFIDDHEQQAISKPFTCDYCEKSFAYRVTLVSHERTHTGELPFQCEFCEKKFPQKRSLILHRRIHTGEKPYGCATCGKRFIQSAHLYAHQRLHTGEKPYLCEVCGEKFRLKDVRDAHRRKHTGERPFKCSVCEKAFRTSHSYYQHMWIHQGKKPYVCQHCGKAFRRSNGLKIHTRIHTGEKPHMCDVCGKCFAQKQDMKKHRNLHTNGRL